MKKYTLFTLLIAGITFTAFKNSENKDVTATSSGIKTKNTPGSQIIYDLDVEKSTFAWTGKKVTGEHSGNVKISNGKVFLNKGKLIGGEFEVDMNTITDESSNDRLVNHLKSEDFFDVANHPKSTFKVKVWAPIEDSQPGAPNYYVKGDLTIRGTTKEISFPATVNMNDKSITALADFTIDRTDYGVKYRSGKFFPDIGDKMIYDEFNIKINLVANAK